MKKKKKWYDYLWILSSLYLVLGFVNILFAWLGMICFLTPLLISVIRGNKAYCNRFCGRGQLFSLLGEKLHLSRNRPIPAWVRSKWFRYGFLTFFMIMFLNMLYVTYLVFAGANDLRETVTLLWTIRLPWSWANHTAVSSPWVAQFAFGFYGVMLTSTVLGLITMLFFKPRSWCVYCPMGTMTQMICKARHPKEAKAAQSCTVCGVPSSEKNHTSMKK
ncbi:MAG: 4Fe-4S binding protein [Clostridiales bacterium]|nr:4Fe-4S binding protein [Clostridiales bacterium]